MQSRAATARAARSPRACAGSKAHPGLFGACMHAIETVGGDEFHRQFAERRRIYVRECQPRIPALPAKDLTKRQQARTLVEGLRRMGPLWSCFAGTPPSFHGEPDAYRALRKLGSAAYPDLAIALADIRDAGRSMSVGGKGDPCSVGFVASNLLREMLRFECGEDLLDRWVQSGTWQSEEKTRAWFVAHATEPTALVFHLLVPSDAPVDPRRVEALLKHRDASVRLAAAVRTRDPDTLLKAAEAVRGIQPTPENYAYFQPHNAALRAWVRAIVETCPVPARTINPLLAQSSPEKRSAILLGLAWFTNGGAAKKRQIAAAICAESLDDKSEDVAFSAALTLHHLSKRAFPTDYDNHRRMIDSARKWAREQKLTR